ncbi:unnamed protein product [Oppiella nova]|uniref:Scavenger receptor class B member 1 n=1 Tax=Oppiella nova TaxID=334625 RepID=A0A7R9M7N0_9ACAR|nr:unnamed protein product [Oppiella nova]CAG2172314.1 unnamed protein product [Oppiella nova]
MGPYVYKEYKTREIIEWSEDKDKVKYYETLKFVFDPELSKGRLDDKITLVNVPLLLIFSIINSAVERFPLTPIVSPIVNNVVNTLLVTHRERFIETRTVGEVLNGRRITLLDTIDIVAKPLRMLGLPIPEYGISAYKLKDNKYGFLAIRNNSKFGPFETMTGERGRDKFDKYSTYLDKSRLGIYRHVSCDALNGTDGSFFGTFVDSSQPLYLFNLHACRSFRLDYSGDSSANGVSAYHYEFPDNLFDGPEYKPENWCFCPKDVDQRKCHGVFDLSQCLAGVPFAMTFPHFLNSPRFLSGVRGLSPDRQKHLGYFDIEPTLGVTLRGSGRFQINLKLRPFTFVPGLNGFKPTLLPYLWIDEGAELSGFLGSLIKAGSYSINAAGYGFILTVLLGVGVSMIGSYLKIKILAFIEKLSGPDIGFYCYDLFPMNNYELYRIIGLIINAVLIILHSMLGFGVIWVGFVDLFDDFIAVWFALNNDCRMGLPVLYRG